MIILAGRSSILDLLDPNLSWCQSGSFDYPNIFQLYQKNNNSVKRNSIPLLRVSVQIKIVLLQQLQRVQDDFYPNTLNLELVKSLFLYQFVFDLLFLPILNGAKVEIYFKVNVN